MTFPVISRGKKCHGIAIACINILTNFHKANGLSTSEVSVLQNSKINLSICVHILIGFPQMLLSLWPAKVFGCTKNKMKQNKKPPKPTRIIGLVPYHLDSTMIQINSVERTTIKLHYKKDFLER